MALQGKDKRRLVYQYLRSLNYTPDEARKLRGRFNLAEIQLQQSKTRSAKRRSVKNYYRNELGMPAKEATRRQGRTTGVWEDHVNFINDNFEDIKSGKIKRPKIPVGLAKAGLDLLTKDLKKLNPNISPIKLIKQFGAQNPDKIANNLLSLKRFKDKMPPEVYADFIKSISAGSEIDDFYANMTEQSSRVTRI